MDYAQALQPPALFLYHIPHHLALQLLRLLILPNNYYSLLPSSYGPPITSLYQPSAHTPSGGQVHLPPVQALHPGPAPPPPDQDQLQGKLTLQAKINIKDKPILIQPLHKAHLHHQCQLLLKLPVHQQTRTLLSTTFDLQGLETRLTEAMGKKLETIGPLQHLCSLTL